MTTKAKAEDVTTEIMPTDLASMDTSEASEKGAEIEILHPVTKMPTGIFFTVLGKDGETFQEHSRNTANERIRQSALASRRGKDTDIRTVEEIEEQAIELLVLCTKGWRSTTKQTDKSVTSHPFVNFAGEQLTFSVANCTKLYTSQIWLRRQIDDAIGDLSNFM